MKENSVKCFEVFCTIFQARRSIEVKIIVSTSLPVELKLILSYSINYTIQKMEL